MSEGIGNVSQHAHDSTERWMREQNRQYQAGKLSEQEIKDLESLEGWRWLNEQKTIKKEETQEIQDEPINHELLINQYEIQMRQACDSYIANERRMRRR